MLLFLRVSPPSRAATFEHARVFCLLYCSRLRESWILAPVVQTFDSAIHYLWSKSLNVLNFDLKQLHFAVEKKAMLNWITRLVT